MMMPCKSLGKYSSRSDDSNECIIYRKCKPKTFSSFVGKVIRDAPVTVAARHLPMDAYNPIDVLRSKGLLNFSQGAARHGDCASDVTLNFYSEELRHSEPVKIFTSNHHFRHGRLVYSSTHEWLPDSPTEIEKYVEWETKGQRALSDVDLRTSTQTVCKKSVRKQLTDLLLRDMERQRIVRRYESDARRRRFCSRSLSPINVCDTKNKNSERYLHTLRSNQVEHSVSPKRFVCHTTNRGLFRHPDRTACVKSSSETSISSRECWFYSSPKKEIAQTSKFEEQYRYIKITPPRPKFEQDLFVIPKHTCRKAHGRSHWNIVRNFVMSSCHEFENPDASSCFRKEEYRHRDHVIRNSEVPDRTAKTSTQHYAKIRRSEDCDASFKNDRRTSRGKSPLKGILSNKHCNVSPPSHKIRFYDGAINGKEKMHYERGEAEYSNLYKHEKTSDYEKSGSFQQGRKEESSDRDYGIQRGLVKSTESDTDSDSIPRTEPFSLSKDLGDETDKVKNHRLSSDTSDTSICTIHHSSDQIKGISSSPKSSYRSTNEQVRANIKKYYKKFKKQNYEHNEPARKRGTERKKPVKVERYQKRDEIKDGKKRRQINPNAIVHMESDGKRLSQHYSDDKVTLDSEKAFAEEEKIQSQKIAFENYSPRKSDTTIKVYREESLDDYLKRVLREDHNKNLRFIESAINREALTEYRRKYANNASTNSDEKHFFRSTETRHDKYEMTDAKRCDSEDCQACIIERLQGEN